MTEPPQGRRAEGDSPTAGATAEQLLEDDLAYFEAWRIWRPGQPYPDAVRWAVERVDLVNVVFENADRAREA